MNGSVDRKSAEVDAIKPPSFLAFIARAVHNPEYQESAKQEAL